MRIEKIEKKVSRREPCTWSQLKRLAKARGYFLETLYASEEERKNGIEEWCRIIWNSQGITFPGNEYPVIGVTGI